MKITQIDAFTERPFRGNPAAVCVVPQFPEAREMQMLAREMNLSETAFLRPVAGGYELRWFTPEAEVDLCGHATLASAHFLWESGLLELAAEARFETRSGVLTARRRGEWIEMDFPAQAPQRAEPPAGLLRAVGVTPEFLGRNQDDWLVEVASEEEVSAVLPDMTLLSQVCERGLMVTAISESESFDFVSRFFAPAVGVPEDPVTGSAHCCLGPYWAAKLGRAEMTAYQASDRGGVVRLQVRGDRVLLSGQAITVMEAELRAAWPQNV